MNEESYRRRLPRTARVLTRRRDRMPVRDRKCDRAAIACVSVGEDTHCPKEEKSGIPIASGDSKIPTSRDASAWRRNIVKILGSVFFVIATLSNYRTNAAPKTLTFFVATNGNDGWSGKLADPNRRKSDGPFASVEKALDATRELRKADGGKSRAVIEMRGGTYFLTHALLINPVDSGLTISAYKKERPIISGGVELKHWSTVAGATNGLVKTTAPKVNGTNLFFGELWVNGKRATRARHPNKGYLEVEALPDATPNWEHGNTRMIFKQGDLQPWPSLTNAEVVVMTRWVESRLPVVSIDEKQRILTFGKKSMFQLGNGDRYYLEHAREALDAPGEWYLDENSGEVLYLPRAGDIKSRAIAPALPQLIRFEGTTNAFVTNVVFAEVTFSHAEWNLPRTVSTGTNYSEFPAGGFAQAAYAVPGAIWGEGVRDCVFTNCNFTHLGGYALELARGCVSNVIAHCTFSDLGAGGIKIGDTARSELAGERAGGNVVKDCEISDGGHVFQSGEGIWIGQSANNLLTHNLIHDFYYTGISIGWTWGYKTSFASNNLVSFNHVHHIGVKSDGDGPVLSDMGGIYTLGMQPGTKIINNLWHDVAGLRYGGWGIYLDEGSSSIVVASNIVYRTTHGGYHQHYGATNIVRNNIFAFGRDAQVQRTRPEPHPSFSFQTNIVYYNTGSLLAGSWAGDQYIIDANVYWDARANAQPITFEGASFDAWRKRGHDTNSVIADPLFVAPEKDDFSLKPKSPALKIGFRSIDMTKVGARR